MKIKIKKPIGIIARDIKYRWIGIGSLILISAGCATDYPGNSAISSSDREQAAAYREQKNESAQRNAAPQPYVSPGQQMFPRSYNHKPYMLEMPQQRQVRPTYNSSQPMSSGVTAKFTGNQRQVMTVTHQMGWECEYQYLGTTFTRVFASVSACPISVGVQ